MSRETMLKNSGYLRAVAWREPREGKIYWIYPRIMVSPKMSRKVGSLPWVFWAFSLSVQFQLFAQLSSSYAQSKKKRPKLACALVNGHPALPDSTAFNPVWHVKYFIANPEIDTRGSWFSCIRGYTYISAPTIEEKVQHSFRRNHTQNLH